jgi:hypothetical protein
MSITIKLDAAALRELFKEPEAQLELQRAVIAEICKGLWPNYVKEDLVKQIDAALAEARPDLLEITRDEKNIANLIGQRIQSMRDNLRGQIKLGQASDEIVKSVDMRISALIKDRVEERVGNLQGIVDQKTETIAERIERNMERWVNEQVQHRIKQGIDLAIEKMRQAL